MKRAIFVLVFIHSFNWLIGQNKTVESAKIAFISQKINITPAQAEKFWPLYNECQDKREEIRNAIRNIYQNLSTQSEMSNEKIKQQVNQLSSFKIEEANLEKEYNIRYLNIITAKQLADLITAERDFQKVLIKKVSGG